jgi:hypothetical protein
LRRSFTYKAANANPCRYTLADEGCKTFRAVKNKEADVCENVGLRAVWLWADHASHSENLFP